MRIAPGAPDGPLRDEETEHVEMLREAMAKLPPSAGDEAEFDLDESPSL